MKSRNTILLLILGVGLFAYIQFFHKKLLTTEQREQRKGKPVQLNRDKVDAITLRNGEGTFEFKKRDGNWYLEAPVKDRAETMNITALFTSAESLNWGAVNMSGDSKEALKEYGLAKGEMSVKFAGQKGLDEYSDRESIEMLVGKDSAVEGRVYYRIDGADVAYIGPKELRDQVTKGVKDWRNRTLSDLTAAQVNKLSLKTAKGELELEKQGANWSFTKPFKARGDNQKVNDLISNATTARIEEFITDSKDLGAYGLTEPRATLTLHAEGQKDPVILQVGSAKQEKKDEKKEEKKDEGKDTPAPATPTPPTHVYVKLSSREGVVTIPAAIETLINTQPNDLRDQSLMRVQSDIVDRITIESAKGKIVLGRSGEEWVRKVEGKNDEPINSAAAAKLLNDLVNAKVTRFVADLASDLKGFGLDQPQTTVTLSSYSTEGTPETKPGEKPIVKLLLGKFEGDAGYAKLEDEPFIVAVPASMQNDIWTDPLQWQDLKILDLKKEDVVGLEVARANQPPLALTREKDQPWKTTKAEDKVNQTNVQSLVNTLSTLRALRWVGATDLAKHGFDKPSLVITYSMADKKTGKVTIGNLSPDQLWHATSEGKTGTFLLNQGDFDTLNAALIEGQKTAVTPPTPGAPAPAGTPPAPITVTTPPVTVPPAGTPPPPAPAPPAPSAPEPKPIDLSKPLPPPTIKPPTAPVPAPAPAPPSAPAPGAEKPADAPKPADSPKPAEAAKPAEAPKPADPAPAAPKPAEEAAPKEQ